MTGVSIVWGVNCFEDHGTYRTLAGGVLRTTGWVTGVLMQILDGPNAGRTTTTSTNGRFYMDGLQDGRFTIRLSKPGYVTAEYIWWIPGGSERNPTLTPAP